MYALGSNTVIHALKGFGGVKNRIELTSPSDLAVPAIAIYELEFGTRKSHNPKQRQRDLDRLLGLVTILPFDSQTAKIASLALHFEDGY